MPSISDLEALLKSEELKISGGIVQQDFTANHFLVFISIHRDHRNLQVPSNQKLAHVKNIAEERGYAVEFILVDEDLNDAEAGARATLLHAFGELIRNVFLTVNKRESLVWIDQKREIDAEELRLIKKKIETYLNGVGLKLADISMVRNENVASNTICLKTLRLISPADADEIAQKLVEKGFQVPSMTWMNHKLDNLRKNNFVVRLKSGKYVLSLSGLKGLGSSKNRSSPDIMRMLDIARRGG